VPQTDAAVTAASEGHCATPRELTESDSCIVTPQNNDTLCAKIQQSRCLIIAARQQTAAVGAESCPVHRSRMPAYFSMVKRLLLGERVTESIIKSLQFRFKWGPQQRILHDLVILINTKCRKACDHLNRCAQSASAESGRWPRAPNRFPPTAEFLL
jgi:hypothetical protein